MKISIDDNSGFCPGVVRAITTAESCLAAKSRLYCLGDIVHNGQEVDRLAAMGLDCIDSSEYHTMSDTTVLLRAHGEPPETYEFARQHNIELIDATCSVVLGLQRRIRQAYEAHPDAQIVIYGKVGHAEVLGLNGQCRNSAIIIESIDDICKIDPRREVILFSQTTMSIATFNSIVERLKSTLPATTAFTYHDTICRQVANRVPNIRRFARRFDLILFIAGRKSSNGRILFEECRAVNPNSHHISDLDEIDENWFRDIESVGICGATSTPKWLMDKAAEFVKHF